MAIEWNRIATCDRCMKVQEDRLSPLVVQSDANPKDWQYRQIRDNAGWGTKALLCPVCIADLERIEREWFEKE